MAWTVIYGLFVATFLTLIVVPILFSLVYKLKIRIQRAKTKREERKTEKLEAATV